MMYLKQCNKEAEKEISEMKASQSHEVVLEKNRMKLMREKKNELTKWLDFEKDGRSLKK